jgi:hypothetical protein
MVIPLSILDTDWTQTLRVQLSRCPIWRALRDSNPCYRRERAMS